MTNSTPQINVPHRFNHQCLCAFAFPRPTSLRPKPPPMRPTHSSSPTQCIVYDPCLIPCKRNCQWNTYTTWWFGEKHFKKLFPLNFSVFGIRVCTFWGWVQSVHRVYFPLSAAEISIQSSPRIFAHHIFFAPLQLYSTVFPSFVDRQRHSPSNWWMHHFTTELYTPEEIALIPTERSEGGVACGLLTSKPPTPMCQQTSASSVFLYFFYSNSLKKIGE